MVDKYSYITVLANDAYLKGVLVLNESLKKVSSKYPLVVLTGKNLSSKSKSILAKNNIEIIEQFSDIEIPKILLENNVNTGYDYWNNTFLKLLIFDLDKFKKLVFLDCDMIVLFNIDELFDKPHMSYVPTERYFGGIMGLNSGTMVIEPKQGYFKEMENILNSMNFEQNSYFGDQSVINEYFSDIEKRAELHLHDGYNAQFGYIQTLVNDYGFSLNPKNNNILKIIHFVGRKKPWMFPLKHIEYYFKYILKQQWILFKIYLEYDKILCKINLNLLFK